jgi:hypothetical protein
MNARFARTVVSVAAVVATVSCTHFYEIPIETPIKPKLDVSAFQRVLVAGFISGGTDDVDANVETTRLLRSQLRTKSDLRVIDADTLPLTEVATRRDPSAAATPAPPIKEAKDLAFYEPVFANVAYWKDIGEEYQQPLIVTGTVLFIPQEQSRPVIRNEEEYDNFGRRTTRTVRSYQELKGFKLSLNVKFIDGRTGAVMSSISPEESNSYPSNQQTPALSAYFELMDRIIPGFLGTLSSQKVKGTRFLLQ